MSEDEIPVPNIVINSPSEEYLEYLKQFRVDINVEEVLELFVGDGENKILQDMMYRIFAGYTPPGGVYMIGGVSKNEYSEEEIVRRKKVAYGAIIRYALESLNQQEDKNFLYYLNKYLLGYFNNDCIELIASQMRPPRRNTENTVKECPIFDYSHLKRKVFPIEEEKKERARNFDNAVANSALSGYRDPYFESLREAYIEGYLTADDIISLPCDYEDNLDSLEARLVSQRTLALSEKD